MFRFGKSSESSPRSPPKSKPSSHAFCRTSTTRSSHGTDAAVVGATCRSPRRRVHSFADHIRASVVCSQWRAAAVANAPLLPLVVLPPTAAPATTARCVRISDVCWLWGTTAAQNPPRLTSVTEPAAPVFLRIFGEDVHRLPTFPDDAPHRAHLRLLPWRMGVPRARAGPRLLPPQPLHPRARVPRRPHTHPIPSHRLLDRHRMRHPVGCPIPRRRLLCRRHHIRARQCRLLAPGGGPVVPAQSCLDRPRSS